MTYPEDLTDEQLRNLIAAWCKLRNEAEEQTKELLREVFRRGHPVGDGYWTAWGYCPK